ncbi:hypothetical protein PG997_013791 [Apiospora hydei]|uniref:Uncharacterized protein n=1 Tax=Apiospora hydei TaxID=1337664 RepID=A0ABR1V761_9PEZI
MNAQWTAPFLKSTFVQEDGAAGGSRDGSRDETRDDEGESEQYGERMRQATATVSIRVAAHSKKNEWRPLAMMQMPRYDARQLID